LFSDCGVVHVILHGTLTLQVTEFGVKVQNVSFVVVALTVNVIVAAVVTTTSFTAADVPPAFETKCEVRYVPAAAYVCCTVAPEVAVSPSPKAQSCSVGAFVDVSVNVAACPALGPAGVTV
jgi:hypothetical protein